MIPSVHRFCRLALLGLLASLLPSIGHASEGVRYLLSPRSTIVQVCPQCTTPAGRPERLSGSFTLTPLPLSSGRRVEALTDLNLQSSSYRVQGSGFVQFLPSGKIAIVIHASINGDDMQLRATRRQPPPGTEFSVLLGTPRGGAVDYLMIVSAVPAEEGPDSDRDGVADADDVCPRVYDPKQLDSDGDGIGDACDLCADTAANEVVSSTGCSVAQTCPCEAAADGKPWRRGAYGKCVAHAVKQLRRDGRVSRKDSLRMLRDALRSGCGQTVVALR